MFRSRVLVTFLCLAVCSAADWKDSLPKDVPGYLQDISVTIKAGTNEGSGVIITRDKANYVLTAGHVIERLRKVDERIDPKTGTKRQVVRFADGSIVKELVERGRRVGELKMDVEVLTYSKHEDLALLRIRKTDFVQASTVFYQGEIFPLGSRLYHVGSLLGQQGAGSMTDGILSQIGRVLDDKREYDQTTVTACPGSSGGCVTLTNGAYVGMLVRGTSTGDNFNLMIPIRRIRVWAKRVGVLWVLDPTVKMPSAEKLRKLPIEDIDASFTRDRDEMNLEFPTLIRETLPVKAKLRRLKMSGGTEK